MEKVDEQVKNVLITVEQAFEKFGLNENYFKECEEIQEKFY